MIRAAILLVIAFTFGFPGGSAARTWFVRADGTGDATTIEAGIDSTAVGDTVAVACGTYVEDNLPITHGIVLRSETGLPGCVTIDANGLGRSLMIDRSPQEVVCVGLTLTGAVNVLDGGGAQLRTTSASFYDCVFADNQAFEGGGIYADSSSLTVVRCEFSGNGASRFGGGIRYLRGEATTLLVDGCSFVGNQANNGGGIHARDGTSITLLNSEFRDNTASINGGAAVLTHSTTLVSGCLFTGNSAAHVGGAVRVHSDADPDPPSVEFVGSRFFQNVASDSGGAVYVAASRSVDFEDCEFVDNQAAAGAAVVANRITEVVTSHNCTFELNTAVRDGGGIYARNVGQVRVDRSLFSRNSADAGGGLYLRNTTVFVDSCGLWSTPLRTSAEESPLWTRPHVCPKRPLPGTAHTIAEPALRSSRRPRQRA